MIPTLYASRLLHIYDILRHVLRLARTKKALAWIAREALQKFFPKFGEWFVERFYDEWIKAPTSVNEIKILEKPYRMAGVPGTVCSQDAVHVAWDRCPYALRADHTGKEGHPILAWIFCVEPSFELLRRRRLVGPPCHGIWSCVNSRGWKFSKQGMESWWL